MTANDVNVNLNVNGNSTGASAEIDEKRLPDCNGLHKNKYENDDADASHVFITGNDALAAAAAAAADDPDPADPNSNSIPADKDASEQQLKLDPGTGDAGGRIVQAYVDASPPLDHVLHSQSESHNDLDLEGTHPPPALNDSFHLNAHNTQCGEGESTVLVTDTAPDFAPPPQPHHSQLHRETKPDVATHTKENNDSQDAATVITPTDLDSDQEKHPTELAVQVLVEDPQNHSALELEQNPKTPSPLEVTVVETQGSEAVPDQDIVVHAGVGNDVNPTQHHSEDDSSYEKVETFTSSDANTTIGDRIPVASIQLEPELVNGHVASENGDLPSGQSEVSVSDKTLVNDIVDANQIMHEQSAPEISHTLPSPGVDENVPAETCGRISPSIMSDKILEQDVIGDCTAPNGIEKCDDARTDAKIGNLDMHSGESADGSFVPGDAKVPTESENASVVVNDTTPSCMANDMNLEIENGSKSTEADENVDTSVSNEMNIESDVSKQIAECGSNSPLSADNLDGETSLNYPDENKSSLLTCTVDLKAEKEVKSTSVALESLVPESEVLNGSVVASERTLNCIEHDVQVENEQEFGDVDGNEKTHQKVEGNGGIDKDEIVTSAPEGSALGVSDGKNVAAELGKRPFYYLIRIPRFDDEKLKTQITQAQIQVDEKTKIRDAIRAEIQNKRATCKEYGDSFEGAISEEKAARDLLKAKRREIDSVQVVINRVKSAISVEDIDGRIHNMKHMMQHETVPLKEEKQLIREIQQLKQLREQISSSMGSQEEVQQALDQKDQAEERLKLLRKEADLLRENVFKAETATKSAKKKYDAEKESLDGSLTQFRNADVIRQEAYTYLKSLKKQLHDKNQYFWKFKDDVTAASDLASKGDKDKLQHHCVNQVERVMQLWNNNDEFRQEYMKYNMRSTLRRLRTLDGRQLGPDEEPPVFPYVVNERVANDNTKSPVSTPDGEKPVVVVETEKMDDKPIAKAEEHKNQKVKTKKTAKPASRIALATASSGDDIEETTHVNHEQTKEEKELARKTEELRKQEEAAILKEQRRLEEKAKAKEAMERKKRNADKAQVRAALRAQKEAEQKEKEREKRARKKERRQTGVEDTISFREGECAPSSVTPTETKESQTKEQPAAVAKMPQKPMHFTKQTKTNSMPLPLRNRGKRRMQPWMWALLIAVALCALLFMVKSSFF